MSGETMAAEIAQQPDMARRQLVELPDETARVAARIRAYGPRFVLLAGRGTSDHAALYAKYLMEIQLALPCGLVSPSAYTGYDAAPDLSGVLVVAVSQSGGSPDMVETVSRARDLGALTLAVSNAPQSPLAAAAELSLDVLAGPELAVAATKSYTAELLALWLLVQSWRQAPATRAAAVPDVMAQHLARSAEIAGIADRYRFTDRLLVTGRGYSYPTAREAALKLMETSYLAAHAFSGADLMHGPLAMVDPEHPVVAVVPDGVGAAAMTPVLERLVAGGADVLVLGGMQTAGLGTLRYRLPLLPEDLAPLADIVPLQLLALDMAVARGADPDHPRGLSKVTETR